MTHRRISLGILALFSALLIIFVASIAVTKAEGDLIFVLREKLLSLGVPVEEISITKRFPLQIEILLRANDGDTELTEEFIHFKQQTFHEVMLAHRFGLKVNALTVVVRNERGDVIDRERIYVNDKGPSQQSSFEGPVLDQKKTEELFRQELQLGKMKLKTLRIQAGAGTDKSVRTAIIELVAPDIESANQSISNFIGSLRHTIRKANQKGARISVCKVLITDENGEILLDYLYDIEIGRQSWKMSKGVSEDWFPHPYKKRRITPAVTSTPWTPPPPPFDSPLSTPTP